MQASVTGLASATGLASVKAVSEKAARASKWVRAPWRSGQPEPVFELAQPPELAFSQTKTGPPSAPVPELRLQLASPQLC